MISKLLLAAALAAAPPPPIQFEEIAAQAGLRFELRNGAVGGFHQIELTLGGVAALDYDNDGCFDIFFTNGAEIATLRKSGPRYFNRLFRNNCNLTFTDVTAETGLAGEGYSMAAAAADMDNDGFTDLFVAGVKGNHLYRNLGNGRFADVTKQAGLASKSPEWAVSAGWFDYDNDGKLDLFVANYVQWDAATEPRCGTPERQYYCHPNAYRGLPNRLFHNEGNGTFRDVSVNSGIAASVGRGMGISFADYDADGDADIFVANDSVRGLLFQNQGGGKFQEVALEAGVALREDGYAIAGMGSDWRDLDNDGRPDLVVSGILNDSFELFRNLGGGAFEDHAQRTGLLLATRQLTGWGLGMYDFDNDGWKDLFFALGHLMQLDRYLGRKSDLPNRVFRNVDGNSLIDVSAAAGPALQLAASYRGAAFADFDNDGRVDVITSAVNAPARLFRNITPRQGHWLAFQLQGGKANRQGLGAEIHVELANGRRLHNHATTAVGYASSSEPLVRFGLGDQAVAKRVEIRWPAGGTRVLENVPADRLVRVVEQLRP